jgi:hypothetical protein
MSKTNKIVGQKSDSRLKSDRNCLMHVPGNKQDTSRYAFCATTLVLTASDRCVVGRVTIDMFPDDILLEVFDSYVYENVVEAWMVLVQVCRKWRN